MARRKQQQQQSESKEQQQPQSPKEQDDQDEPCRGDVIDYGNNDDDDEHHDSFELDQPKRIGRNASILLSPTQDIMNKLFISKEELGGSKVFQESFNSSMKFFVNDSANSDTTFHDCYDMEYFSDNDNGEIDEEVDDRQPIILGEGAFAIVYRCIHKVNGRHYAVKEIGNNASYTSCNGNSIKFEIQALRKLKDYPNLVTPLFDVFDSDLNDETYLVMEEMKGGNLLERLQIKEFYPEKEAKKVVRTCLEAIKCCHQKLIVHRDIKPENILLLSPEDDTKIKLADFGCSKKIIPGNTSYLRTLCGTKYYVAPEILMVEEEDPQSGYDERCDIWSIGVLAYVLLAGYQPFEGSDEEISEFICGGDYEFHEKYWSDVGLQPKKLIRGLLTVDPDLRMTINRALDSDWLSRKSTTTTTTQSPPAKSSNTFSNINNNKIKTPALKKKERNRGIKGEKKKSKSSKDQLRQQKGDSSTTSSSPLATAKPLSLAALPTKKKKSKSSQLLSDSPASSPITATILATPNTSPMKSKKSKSKQFPPKSPASFPTTPSAPATPTTPQTKKKKSKLKSKQLSPKSPASSKGMQKRSLSTKEVENDRLSSPKTPSPSSPSKTKKSFMSKLLSPRRPPSSSL